MRFYAFLALISLSLPLSRAMAQQPAAPIATATKKSEPLVSLDLSYPRLSDIVTLLGQKYHVNIVTDAYLIDPCGDGANRVVMKDVPLSTALPKLAQLFHRDMEIVYNVVVWRHPQWNFSIKSDQAGMDEYHLAWKDAGKAQAKREQILAADSKPLFPPEKPASPVKPEDELPARLVTLEAVEASAHDVARALSAASAWGVSIDQEIETHRVNMQLHGVTPAQAAELLTLALNARQRIVVGQSDAQKRLAAKSIKDFYNPRTPWDKQSDALKAELNKALTKEQRDKLANNEMVNLNLKALPASLQQLARDYINTTIEEMKKLGSDFPDFDSVRGYTLVLRPEAGLHVGINAYSADGRLYGF